MSEREGFIRLGKRHQPRALAERLDLTGRLDITEEKLS
jgi:hypothetical protein